MHLPGEQFTNLCLQVQSAAHVLSIRHGDQRGVRSAVRQPLHRAVICHVRAPRAVFNTMYLWPIHRKRLAQPVPLKHTHRFREQPMTGRQSFSARLYDDGVTFTLLLYARCYDIPFYRLLLIFYLLIKQMIPNGSLKDWVDIFYLTKYYVNLTLRYCCSYWFSILLTFNFNFINYSFVFCLTFFRITFITFIFMTFSAKNCF